MIKKSTTIAIAVASALLLPVSAFARGTGAGGATAGGVASGNAVGTQTRARQVPGPQE
jgi:hypothetical protein